MPVARPVVNSAGEEYPSMMDATRAMGLKSISCISVAIIGSETGNYRTAVGLQWAYVDAQPDAWPVKKSRPPSPPRPSSPRQPSDRPAGLLLEPMFASDIEGVEWRPIPGLEDYEVNTESYVRDAGSMIRLKEWYRGELSRVEIDGRSYKCVDLMLLAFIGPKPCGYVVQKRVGVSEKLINVFYGPRKPRVSLIEDQNES